MAGTDSQLPAAPNADATPTPAATIASAAPALATHEEIATETNTEEAHDDEEDEDVVTLQEIVQEQSELHDAAAAVLGDASTDSCSYELGYYRQALYACLTCTPGPLDQDKVAGVCLACSYHCHADHDIVELYTKRDFRCDCGNDRFSMDAKCVLFADKAPTNDRNKYSQNFVGTYCVCHRPYPDPARTTPEVMVQCIVCEDWLHEEHIFSSPDARLSVQFDELICAPCMAKHPFLAAYQLLQSDDATADITVGEGECVLALLEARQVTANTNTDDNSAPGPTFWSVEWRTRLCSCSKCVARMEREQIAFLMDVEDSLYAYEERAKEQQQELEAASTHTASSSGTSTTVSRTATTTNSASTDPVVSSTIETAMSSLEAAAERAFQSNLSHEQQIEMAMGYNHMKTQLQSYLSRFATTGKTVRAQDIQEFFQELRESKRQRTT